MNAENPDIGRFSCKIVKKPAFTRVFQRPKGKV